jgi:hypothetical protein
MAHLERTPSPRYRTSHSIPSLRPAALLDVTLRRGDEFRQWSIRPRDIGWDCRILGADSVIVSGCQTLNDAIVRKHDWEAEIVRARADGWA